MALHVDIQKRLGDFHLNVHFTADGEMLGLLGASGSGKSMTLRCIAGIERPDTGRIVLDGRVLFDSEQHIDLAPRQRRIGYLFQQYALFPNMTVAQNIAAGFLHGSRAQRRAAVAEKIRAFRLCGTEDMRPCQLSGGQQQRVALARILLGKPSLILLDEPFSALDSYLQWQLEAELMDMLRAFPGSAILVSHDRGEVYRICKRVCVLNNGRSEPAEETKALFASPKTISAARLSGCKNYAAAVPAQQPLSVLIPAWNISLRTAAPLNGAKYIGIRAHQLHMAANGDENHIPCRVISVWEDVSGVAVMLLPLAAADDAPALRMELPNSGRCPSPGAALTVSIPPEDILLLKE